MLMAQLGTNGPSIPRIGYGAMVLEGYYGASDDTTFRLHAGMTLRDL